MGTKTKQMMANSNLAEVLENLKSLSDEEKEKVLQELKHEVCGTPIPEGEYLTIKEVSAYLLKALTSTTTDLNKIETSFQLRFDT